MAQDMEAFVDLADEAQDWVEEVRHVTPPAAPPASLMSWRAVMDRPANCTPTVLLLDYWTLLSATLL